MAAKRDVLKVLSKHRDRALKELGYRPDMGWPYSETPAHPLKVKVHREFDRRLKALYKSVAAKHGLTVEERSNGFSYSYPDLYLNGESLTDIQLRAFREKREAAQAKVYAIYEAFETAEEQLLLKGASADLTEIFDTFVAALKEITSS